MHTKCAVISLVACLFLCVHVGCSRTDSRTIEQLKAHFANEGFSGVTRDKLFYLVGAKDGIGYTGDGFSVEIYVFDDVSKAEGFAEVGLLESECFQNGCFVLLVHEAPVDLLSAFQEF
tara:strand:- start:527 stop:880 length:354 start_codon:yes stop_codon:yes gene_type:complete